MIKIMRGDGLREHDANITTIPETRSWLITLVIDDIKLFIKKIYFARTYWYLIV